MRKAQEEEKLREIHTPVETLTKPRLCGQVSSGGSTYNKRMSQIKSRLSLFQNAHIASSGSKADYPVLEDDASDVSSCESNFFNQLSDRARLNSIKIASRNLIQNANFKQQDKFEDSYILCEKIGEGMHS